MAHVHLEGSLNVAGPLWVGASFDGFGEVEGGTMRGHSAWITPEVDLRFGNFSMGIPIPIKVGGDRHNEVPPMFVY